MRVFKWNVTKRSMRWRLHYWTHRRRIIAARAQAYREQVEAEQWAAELDPLNLNVKQRVILFTSRSGEVVTGDEDVAKLHTRLTPDELFKEEL